MKHRWLNNLNKYQKRTHGILNAGGLREKDRKENVKEEWDTLELKIIRSVETNIGRKNE